MNSSALAILASFGLLIGIVWFLISVVRTAFPRWRKSGVKHARLSALLAIVSIISTIWLAPTRSPVSPPAQVHHSAERAEVSSLVLEDPAARKAAVDEKLKEMAAAQTTTVVDKGALPSDEEEPPAIDLSHWEVRTGQSAMDDSPTVRIDTRSVGMHMNRYGQQRHLILTIICSENVTNAYISFAEHFMSDLNRGGRVTYRIDDQKAKHRIFRESNDHSVLGLWGGGNSIPWLKELFGAKRLVVRATPFSESEVEGQFNIAGLEEVIKPLREACNW